MLLRLNFIMVFLCFSCNSQQQDLIVYKEGETMPKLITNGRGLETIKDYFSELFKKATGSEPGGKSREDAVIIKLSLSKKGKGGYFSLTEDKGVITIEGLSTADVAKGVNYFFREYANLIYVSGKGFTGSRLKVISVPKKLDYHRANAFAYREPYFPDNYDKGFRDAYATHAMEDNWGLWGHNIGKVVEVSPKMLAMVKGNLCEDQFCFSSPELEDALASFVNAQYDENPGFTKFMIQPNDNEMICMCSRCKAAGNTAKNASPAVFSLLNKLAKKFPEKQFFSTAYITTQHPPKFKLANNAAVMISTMAFPKGIVLETSNKKHQVEKTFSEWGRVAKTIYLWDYAVNFDNYFKAYPTVLTTQANLKYYKKLGVSGVFMQGSEGDYSAFSDLKCYLYALLLSDPDTDVKKEIARFFKVKYPGTADLLTGYYTKIEQQNFESKKPLDIYGGMLQSKKKYLNEDALTNFYTELLKREESVSSTEKKDIKPLLLSFTFMKLELLRTKSGHIVDTREAKPLLDRMMRLSKETGIKGYDELLRPIADYNAEWNSDILDKPYNNLAFGKAVTLEFKPDEDYEDPAVLTDGAVGFTDYYNNWMLCTAEALAVSIKADAVKGTKTIEMNFLQDIKHNIFVPKKVEITIGTKKYEAVITTNADDKLVKKHVSIAVDITPADKEIFIKTIKAEEYKTKSIACDELFFKK